MEENIADALKMAGSVLLFVMGLSIAILTFTQARQSINTVLSYSDREYLTIENDSRFYYLASENDTNRYVGIETIIPTLYRAYKENYKVIFKFPNQNDYLYKKNEDGTTVSKIDLENQTIGSDLESRQFLDGIIYDGYNVDEDYKSKFKITPNEKCLYNYISEKKDSNYLIKESLGTYYMEDIDSDGDGHPDWETYNEGSKQWVINKPLSNRTLKRVITYTFEKIE